MLAEDLTLVPLALTDEDVEVSLLDVTQLSDTESTATRFLTRAELGEYRKLRHPARRREWLGVRVCLKTMLLRRRWIDDPTECELTKDAAGRPWLGFVRGRPVEVVHDCSLSHKGRFACAAASRVPATRVGVDIEEISPRLLRLERAFAGDRDRPIRSRAPEERLALLWALKEACAKAVGGGLGFALGAVECEETVEGQHRARTADGREFRARHVMHDRYVVVLCLTEGEAWAPAQ